MIKKVFRHIRNLINKFSRKRYVKKLKKEFSNNSLSVFSSNCVGACMLHDLGVRFNSPFVNLYISAQDYLKFLESPHKYCAMQFEKLATDTDYPVAKLGDITFHFVTMQVLTRRSKRSEREQSV